MCGVQTHVNTLCQPRVQDGWTALHASAQNGHIEVARLLLDSKADIHAATEVPRSGPPPACAAAASRPVSLSSSESSAPRLLGSGTRAAIGPIRRRPVKSEGVPRSSVGATDRAGRDGVFKARCRDPARPQPAQMLTPAR